MTGVAATDGRAAWWYAVLSIVAAVLTIGLKVGAYLLTGSGASSQTRPSLWST